MNLGFDAKRLFANTSGLGNYSRTLVRNLVKYYPDEEYHLYTTSRNESIELADLLSHKQVHQTSKSGLLKAWWRSVGIKHDLLSDKVDLYHGLSHEIPMGISKSGIKSVVTIHDLIYKVYPEQFSAIDRKIYDLKFGYSIRNADRIIAITEHTKHDIIERYPEVDPSTIEVIYQTCEALFFNVEQGAELSREVADKFALPSEYMLCVGSFVERKNLALLVRAYSHLGHHAKLPLVAVGRGKAYKREVEKLAHELGVRDRIYFLEDVNSTPDLVEIYRRASIFIYPSIYEGFGIPILESLLCGTPVIASTMPALREAGGGHSLYVDPSDALALAEAIIRVLEDEELRKTMIASGRAFAHRSFSPEVLSGKLMEVYRGLS